SYTPGMMAAPAIKAAKSKAAPSRPKTRTSTQTGSSAKKTKTLDGFFQVKADKK
ncbi:hypothetical protein EC988_006818, partial [Linderina pennispora]